MSTLATRKRSSRTGTDFSLPPPTARTPASKPVAKSHGTRRCKKRGAGLLSILAFHHRRERLRRILQRGDIQLNATLDQSPCRGEIALSIDAHRIDEPSVAHVEDQHVVAAELAMDDRTLRFGPANALDVQVVLLGPERRYGGVDVAASRRIAAGNGSLIQ